MNAKTCLVLLSMMFGPLGTACGGTDAQAHAAPEPPAPRAAQLGDGTPGSVVLIEVIGPGAGLKVPRDLAFNPLRPNELWVINFGDDSMVIASDVLDPAAPVDRRKDAAANHFMAKPSSIAFGADDTTIGRPGTFATCQESSKTNDDKEAPNDFMGPTLWSGRRKPKRPRQIPAFEFTYRHDPDLHSGRPVRP